MKDRHATPATTQLRAGGSPIHLGEVRRGVAQVADEIGKLEAFNNRLRAECLNASWFLSLADPHDRLEAWRGEYNDERPHGSLRNLTPRAFADQAEQARRVA